MGDYYCSDMLTICKDDNKKKRRYNFDLIARFTNFLFVGEDTISFIEFLRYLDPVRSYNLLYLGKNGTEINKKYGGKVLPPGKKLIVLGEMSSIVRYLMNDGDVSFNVFLDHEMSQLYMTKLLPMLGRTSLEDLNAMGFPLFDKYLNCVVRQGEVYPTQVPERVQVGVRFLINGCVKSMSSSKGYNKMQYVTQQKYLHYTIVEVKCEGQLKYECNSYHCHGYPGVESDHLHLVKVGDSFESKVSEVTRIDHTLLSLVPYIVSRSLLVRIYESRVSRDELEEYMDLMEYHPDVIRVGDWFLIQGNRNDIDPVDMEVIAKEADSVGMNYVKYLTDKFGVELLCEELSGQKMYTKPYVYEVITDTYHRWFVSVHEYMKYTKDINFLRVKGMTPDMGQRHNDDFCVWDSGQFYWTVYYYGK